jgi:two-component system, cell cycle sensor histidine kinase and response regulator CckA
MDSGAPSPHPGAAPSLWAVLAASPNAIVAADRDGHIRYVNRQATVTFGYAEDELVGAPVELLLPPGLAERHARHRATFGDRPVARPMGIGMDLAGRRKDGSSFPVEISLSPVDGPAGPLVFATIVDITARKTAERQLLQAQKLESIGRLAGGIAHDFNNMLFAIRGYAELLELDLGEAPGTAPDLDAARSSVRAIEDAVERAATLTGRLLAFSRQQVVMPSVLGLNEAVRAMEPLLRRLIGEQVELVLRLSARHDRVRIDPSQLDQVLLNLAVNARDAMEHGGRLMVETGETVFDEAYAMEHFEVQPGAYVALIVSDEGVGMDAETRTHVFEPFFTTKGPGKGTGLGLATTYGIVRQAGGHIWLYSEPGIGTSFKIYLPQLDAPVSGRPDANDDRGGGRGTAVLVVEDEPSVREVTARLLTRLGFRVTAVGTPREALERLAEMADRLDVLVTDVVMPGMSGIALAERVLERHPGVGVVLLSGYTPETLDLDAIQARGARFAAKPVTSQRLLATIAEATAAAREAAGR